MDSLQDSMVCSYMIFIPQLPVTGREIRHYFEAGREIRHYSEGGRKIMHYFEGRSKIMCSNWLISSRLKLYAKLEYSIMPYIFSKKKTFIGIWPKQD